MLIHYIFQVPPDDQGLGQKVPFTLPSVRAYQEYPTGFCFFFSIEDHSLSCYKKLTICTNVQELTQHQFRLTKSLQGIYRNQHMTNL